MASAGHDLGQSEVETSTLITNTDWKCYQEQIRVKYLEEDNTLDQLLQWLNDEKACCVTERQLTYQLSKWKYFKKRSYLRPQPIPRASTLQSSSETIPGSCSACTPMADPNDVAWSEERATLAGLIGGPSSVLATTERPLTSAPIEEIEVVSHKSGQDSTLAPSVTSSRLTGWHSMHSLNRRLQVQGDNKSEVSSHISLKSMSSHDLQHLGYAVESDRALLASMGVSMLSHLNEIDENPLADISQEESLAGISRTMSDSSNTAIHERRGYPPRPYHE